MSFSQYEPEPRHYVHSDAASQGGGWLQGFVARLTVNAHADDAVARRERADIRADRVDDAGEFAAGGVRKLRLELIFATNNETVREIDARRLDGNEHLVSFGSGRRNRLDGVRGGWAVRANEIRAVHGRAEASAAP